MENIYDEYIILTKEIELLEEKKKGLRDKIEATLPPEGFKDERITAFWKTNRKWDYTDATKAKEEEVKAASEELRNQKKMEEETGVAVVVEEVKSLTISVK